LRQNEAGHIRYSSEVQRIARGEGTSFVLHLVGGVNMTCGAVVNAGGLWLPNKPSKLLSQGFELATNYDDLPDEKEYARLYEGKRVAVFGLGNAAMETADALADAGVAFVHIFRGRCVSQVLDQQSA
jgi:cation diffusion facilitator CzcD-associated flavoprotein CzcO